MTRADIAHNRRIRAQDPIRCLDGSTYQGAGRNAPAGIVGILVACLLLAAALSAFSWAFAHGGLRALVEALTS